MAEAGPYTQKAVGSADPVDPQSSALAAQEAASAVGQGAASSAFEVAPAVGGAAVQAATAPIDPPDEQQQPVFGRRRSGTFDPFAGSIMPDPETLQGNREPITVAHSGSVGPYGGRPIFVTGDTGQLPLAALASVQNKRAVELQKLNEEAKSLGVDSNFEEIARPEYRANLRLWQRQQLEKAHSALLSLYGSERKLNAALKDPNSAAHRAMLGPGGIVDSINSVVKNFNQASKEAQAVIDGMDKNEIFFNEKVYNKANNLLHAFGQYAHGDVRKLGKDIHEFRTVMSADKFVRDNKITDRIIQEAGINPDTDIDKKSGMIIVTTDSEKRLKESAKRAIDGIMRQPYWKRQPEARQAFEDILQFENQIIRKVTTAKPPGSGGGSGSGAPQEGKLSMGAGMAPAPIEAYSGPQMRKTIESGGSMPRVPTVWPTEATSGKYSQLAPRDFVDSSGATHRLYGIHFQRIDGADKIVGRALGQDEITKLRDITGGATGMNAAQINEVIDQQKLGTVKVLNMDDNMAPLESMFGKDYISRTKQSLFEQGRANSAPVQKTPVASQPPKYTPPVIGEIRAGYKYIGGDPKLKTSYVKVN